jgi:hypothetical protein
MTFFSPLISRKNAVVEKHQLEGNDAARRNFVRIVPVTRTATGYTAKVQYESVTAEIPSHPTIGEAIEALARKLQELGFSRLRSRINFRGSRYLAEKEPWIDYPDLPSRSKS